MRNNTLETRIKGFNAKKSYLQPLMQFTEKVSVFTVFGSSKLFSTLFRWCITEGNWVSEFGDQTHVFIAEIPIKFRVYVSHVILFSWDQFKLMEECWTT